MTSQAEIGESLDRPVICRLDIGNLETVALDTIASGVQVEVVSVTGEDALSERLLASGLWPGAVVERIASAPFGDPVLFRLHGYRLALRRAEAARVQVVAAPAGRDAT